MKVPLALLWRGRGWFGYKHSTPPLVHKIDYQVDERRRIVRDPKSAVRHNLISEENNLLEGGDI